jgi:hypothetical protein
MECDVPDRDIAMSGNRKHHFCFTLSIALNLNYNPTGLCADFKSRLAKMRGGRAMASFHVKGELVPRANDDVIGEFSLAKRAALMRTKPIDCIVAVFEAGDGEHEPASNDFTHSVQWKLVFGANIDPMAA